MQLVYHLLMEPLLLLEELLTQIPEGGGEGEEVRVRR